MYGDLKSDLRYRDRLFGATSATRGPPLRRLVERARFPRRPDGDGLWSLFNRDDAVTQPAARDSSHPIGFSIR